MLCLDEKKQITIVNVREEKNVYTDTRKVTPAQFNLKASPANNTKT